MEYALKIENVSKKYEGFQLSNVNIAIPRGCIMGFIGENGAGKSTTIKLILDLIKRDSGNISILGMDNREGLSEIKEKIGIVVDEGFFYEGLTVKEVGNVMRNMYKNWHQEQFLNYMNRFSIPIKKKLKELSKGMKMKLYIATAISHGASLLILDEATSGLDPIVREEILDVFMEFIQDERNTIFMSSHILSDLEKVCDYVTFIHKGKIVFSEEKDQLLEDYAVLKCSESEFKMIDKTCVKGHRKNEFGIEALVYKNKIRQNVIIDKATIEDIMLYYVKNK